MNYFISVFCIFFAVICAALAYIEYKAYIGYEDCTQETHGELKILKVSGSTGRSRRITGEISFTTLNGKFITIKYSNELFKGAPRIDNGSANKKIPLVIMYDPTAPSANYYIKNYYSGKRTFIAYAITSLLSIIVALVIFL